MLDQRKVVPDAIFCVYSTNPCRHNSYLGVSQTRAKKLNPRTSMGLNCARPTISNVKAIPVVLNLNATLEPTRYSSQPGDL